MTWQRHCPALQGGEKRKTTVQPCYPRDHGRESLWLLRGIVTGRERIARSLHRAVRDLVVMTFYLIAICLAMTSDSRGSQMSASGPSVQWRNSAVRRAFGENPRSGGRVDVQRQDQSGPQAASPKSTAVHRKLWTAASETKTAPVTGACRYRDEHRTRGASPSSPPRMTNNNDSTRGQGWTRTTNLGAS